jgi:hypothetical protein
MLQFCSEESDLEARGTRFHIWLRHYAASRRAMGSIPDEVISFLNRLKSFSCAIDSAFNRNGHEESSSG